ncbi:hypothetical protein ES705_09614 [subsurface metagenome]
MTMSIWLRSPKSLFHFVRQKLQSHTNRYTQDEVITVLIQY